MISLNDQRTLSKRVSFRYYILVSARAALLAATLTACGDPSMSSDRVPTPDNSAKVDARAYLTMSADERARKEQEAVNAIVARAPQDRQQEVRNLLQGSTNSFLAIESKDPEVTRQFAVVKAIRAANAARAADPARQTTDAGRRPTIVEVKVALVDRLEPAGVRARVVRTPEDGGVPLLILRESDVSLVDLHFGLKFAAQSVIKHGQRPAKKVTLDYTSKRTGGQGLPPGALGSPSTLELLKSRRTQEVEGVGMARVAPMSIRLDEPPPPPKR